MRPSKHSIKQLPDSAADFYELRFKLARLSQAECADLLGVNVRTVKRWESGKARVPRSVVLALALLAGDLGFVWEQWQGWRLDYQTASIVAPNGYRFDQGEMLALPYLYAQLSDAERRARGWISDKPIADNVAPLKRRDAAS